MCADAAQGATDAKRFCKTPIEEHDPEFGVEHAEALRHLADGYRVQRENGAKLVVSVLAIRSVNGRCHSRIATQVGSQAFKGFFKRETEISR
jgi:hypothetical protein